MHISNYISINDMISRLKNTPSIDIDEMYKYDLAIKTYEILLLSLNVNVGIQKFIVDIDNNRSVMALIFQNKEVPEMMESYILDKDYDNNIVFRGIKSTFVNNDTGVDLIDESERISKSLKANTLHIRKLMQESFGSMTESQVEDDDIIVPDVSALSALTDDIEVDNNKDINGDIISDTLIPLVTFRAISLNGDSDSYHGVIEITENSVFSLCQEDFTKDDYLNICKVNKVLSRIDTMYIFETNLNKYAQAYAVLVRGINKSDAENMNPLSIIKEGDYFTIDIDESDNIPYTLAYDTVENTFIKKPFADINHKEVLVCYPWFPKNVNPDFYHITEVDYEDDKRNGVFLVEENMLSSLSKYNRMKGLYAEASLQQTAMNIVRKMKDIPADLYDKYKEIQQNIKTILRDYKKASDDKLREEIIMDEYIPELKKLMNFLKGLSGGYLLVFVGIASPLVGVLAGGIIFMLDKMKDDKNRRRALGFIQNELDMQEEKIADARNKGDDKAKYELMRFKHVLNEKLEKYING